MIQPADEIADLCRRFPGLEAWIVEEPTESGGPAPALAHMGALRP